MLRIKWVLGVIVIRAFLLTLVLSLLIAVGCANPSRQEPKVGSQEEG